jgi:hypothetical protein
MTSLDDLKQQIQAAYDEVDVATDVYDELARKIVNIERQSFYGRESERDRLGKIRECIAEAVRDEGAR